MNRIQKEILYNYILYFGLLILLLNFFMEFYSPIKSEFFGILHDFTFLTVFTIVFFKSKRIILFIGFLFLTFRFNIELLYYSALPFKNSYILSDDLKRLELILFILGVICYMLGYYNIVKNRYFNRKVNIDDLLILIITVITTLIVQVFIRTI